MKNVQWLYIYSYIYMCDFPLKIKLWHIGVYATFYKLYNLDYHKICSLMLFYNFEENIEENNCRFYFKNTFK